MEIRMHSPEFLMPGSHLQFDYRRFIHTRDLLRELVVRDIKIRYKGSLFGIAWLVINSLIQLSVFHLMFHSVLGSTISNYPLYIFIGILSWSWFQTSLLQGVGTFTSNRELVRKPGFPVAILPITIVITHLIDFLLQLPVLFIFLIVSGIDLTVSFLVLPLIMAIQFSFNIAIIYLLAALQINYRDIRHLLSAILGVGFFLTPIFYDASIVNAEYQSFYKLNPMVHLLNSYRSALLEGNFPDPLPLLFLVVLTIIIFPFVYWVFKRARYRCLEEI